MNEFPANTAGSSILPLVSRTFNMRKRIISAAKAHRQLDILQLAVQSIYELPA
jgi:hypothetical protein